MDAARALGCLQRQELGMLSVELHPSIPMFNHFPVRGNGGL